MRRSPVLRSARPRPLRAAALALLLGGLLACGGADEAGDEGAASRRGVEEEVWTPGESAEPRTGSASEEPAPPEAGAGEEPPADATAVARAEVERLEARVRRAERELEEAHADLADAREALATAERGPWRSDAALFREVQRRLLEDPALGRVAIRADVDEGVVVLHGRVPDRDTARAAGAVAAGVGGVVRVESRIEVAEDEG